MTKTPTVSIVIPVYNAAPWLSLVLDSLAAQTMQDFEVVAVNDGSSDDSLRILQARNWNKLRIVDQQNSGQSAAINRGVSESRGRYIKLVDHDDWINPEHLEAQLQSLTGRLSCVSACQWGYFRDNPENVIPRPEHCNRDYDDPLEWIVDCLTRDEGMMGGWKWLIPRELWERSGGYDARIGLNNDFYGSTAILLQAQGVRFAAGAVYGYRKAIRGALSVVRSRGAFESAMLASRLCRDLLLERESSARIRSICADRFQRWTFDMYPEYPDLVGEAEQAIQELGGSALEFPAGLVGRNLAQLVGWKAVRSLQRIARRYGWSGIQRIKQGLREQALEQ